MEQDKSVRKKRNKLSKCISQTQFIAYGFFIIIMTGTLLLMLPIASRDGAVGAVFKLPVHSHQRHLRDRAGGGGHLDPVEPLWSGAFADYDPVGRPGLYQYRYIPLHCAAAQDWVKGTGPYGRERQHAADWRHGEAGQTDYHSTAIFEGTGAIILSLRFIPQYGLFQGTGMAYSIPYPRSVMRGLT